MALKARHAATLVTLTAERHDAHSALARETQTTARLRAALDELSADISREVYGRRREVSLRLALLGREERVSEHLRKWVRRSEETIARGRAGGGSEGTSFLMLEAVTRDARRVLHALDEDVDSDSLSSGTVSRIVAAQGAVTMLTKELRVETERRLWLERALTQMPGAEDTGKIMPCHSEIGAGPCHVQTGYFSEGVFQRGRAPATECLPKPEPFVVSPVLEPSDNDMQVLSTSTENLDMDSPHIPPLTLSPSPTRSSLSSRTQGLDSGHDATLGHVPIPISTDSYPPVHSHTLLVDLAHVGRRYDELQHGFRDCYLALRDLNASMPAPSSDSSSSASLQISATQVPAWGPVLQAVVEHLYHYTEDARVELEIRVADEALLARGFEVLLCSPGALSRLDQIHGSLPNNEDNENHHSEQGDVERDIRAFIDGTEHSVQKALNNFTTKLEDIQHDIAAIKRILHNEVPPVPVSPGPGTGTGTWSTWTAGIFAGGGTPPASPAPTFGSVMTTPRLRQSPSLSAYNHLASVSNSTAGQADMSDPFVGLGLRVPMPKYAHSSVSSVRPTTRTRTLSAMYMLGLGAQSGASKSPFATAAALPGRDKVSSDEVPCQEEAGNDAVEAGGDMDVE
jgi:hypothetical protein